MKKIIVFYPYPTSEKEQPVVDDFLEMAADAERHKSFD